MEKQLIIAILIILVIATVISSAGVYMINNIQNKLDTMSKRVSANDAEVKRDVSASELSSALRSKLSGADVSELNLKFNQ